MEDAALADELIRRLNKLIEDPGVRRDLGLYIESRVPVGRTTAEHPTIQVNENQMLGFLGLLNGIVGVIQDGSHAGWGYISARFDDNGNLTSFERTA